MSLLKYIIALALLIPLCNNAEQSNLKQEIINQLKKEKILTGPFIFAGKSEINNPSDFLFPVREEINNKLLDSLKKYQIDQHIDVYRSITLKENGKSPQQIVHYSNIYQFDDLKFICLMIGTYSKDPTVSNSYKFYQGKATFAVVVLNNDFEILNFFGWESQVDMF